MDEASSRIACGRNIGMAKDFLCENQGNTRANKSAPPLLSLNKRWRALF